MQCCIAADGAGGQAGGREGKKRRGERGDSTSLVGGTALTLRVSQGERNTEGLRDASPVPVSSPTPSWLGFNVPWGRWMAGTFREVATHTATDLHCRQSRAASRTRTELETLTTHAHTTLVVSTIAASQLDGVKVWWLAGWLPCVYEILG